MLAFFEVFGLGSLVFLMAAEMNPDAKAEESPVFATTRWTMVLTAANGESAQQSDALNQLCNCYWYPVFAYVRSRGYGHHDSQDLTQAFLSRFLQAQHFGRATRDRGKFRSYLLGALKHFLANDYDWKQAAKRGGARVHVPFDTSLTESQTVLEIRTDMTPDSYFDRSWALALLERARGRLESEYAEVGKGDRFARLGSFLPGGQATESYAEIAELLGSSEGALRVELHRLKKKFSRYVREEIAHTVSTPIEIDEELRYLMEALQ